MTEVPAARFEGAATDGGSRGILSRVSDFVQAYGVDSVDRERIAQTLSAFLGLAARHASPRSDARIAVIADVMPEDVQLVLRLCPAGTLGGIDGRDAVGGLELWISFPRPPGLRIP
jgi:hypothetical protein